jgi:hypothetical protein
VKHYEILGDHLTKMKGYESYGRMQEMASAPGGVEALTEFFVNLQVWGTPEQCYEKILDIQRRTGAEAYNGGLQLRGHAVRHRRGEHAPLRERGGARAPEARAARGPADRARRVGSHADAAAFRLPA